MTKKPSIWTQPSMLGPPSACAVTITLMIDVVPPRCSVHVGAVNPATDELLALAQSPVVPWTSPSSITAATMSLVDEILQDVLRPF